MELTKFAQSTIRVKNSGGGVLLFDPGAYNVERGFLCQSQNLQCDVLVITHKHSDHYDPAVLDQVKSARGRPYTLCGEDLKEQIADLGFLASAVHWGDIVEHAGFRLLVTRADHFVGGESVPVFGMVIQADGRTIYHSSDTQYQPPHILGITQHINWAFLPFSGREVMMDQDEAIRFVIELRPDVVVPVHYDSPKDIHLQPMVFAERIQREANVRARVLDYGETVTV